jgi:hypothetical protein
MHQATLLLANPQKATVYWFVARGSGFVVYGLLTVAVCLGLLLALRWRTDAWPRMITEELHPFVLIVAAVFLCLHIVSVFLDTFIHFQWYQVLIPFTSSYRVVWISLGIIAMYLGAALALSIYLRPFIGYRAWRTMHYAGFLAWSLALVHGIATGTDASSPWAIAIYGGSVLLVVALLAIRFGGVPISLGSPPRLRVPVLVSLSALLILGGYLATAGPWAPGWASRAQGLLSQSSPPLVAAVPLTVPASFSAPVSGTAHVENPGSLQQGTGLLHMRLTSHGRYRTSLGYALLLAAVQGGAQFIRGIYSLAPANLAWNCSGTVTYRPPDVLDSTCVVPRVRTTEIVTRFRLSPSGVVSGGVTAVPAAKPGQPSDGEGQGDNDTGKLGAGA